MSAVVSCISMSITAPERLVYMLGLVTSPDGPGQIILSLMCFDPHFF